MNHDAIASQIDPPFVRIAADGNVERAEYTATIALVPMRRWQREEINVLAFEDISISGPLPQREPEAASDY